MMLEAATRVWREPDAPGVPCKQGGAVKMSSASARTTVDQPETRSRELGEGGIPWK
jgi:hypothetical protein